MKKVYCKDCKFAPLLHFPDCSPYLVVNMRVNDYHSPRHFIEKQQIGEFSRGKQNEGNDCKLYKRKWWKVWVR